MTATSTTSAPLARATARGAPRGGVVGGASVPGTLPPEYDPDAVAKAGAHLRGQIFGIGLSIAWALVFLVLGTCLFFGVEMLTAIWITIVSFATVVFVSFFAELIVEPSLEKVAQEREEARIEREREDAPTAGGVLSARLALTGGADDSQQISPGGRPVGAAGSVGGSAAARGRRLDVTLPEEQAGAPPPRAASGAVGGPNRAAAPEPAAAAQPQEGFQDLASLLREAAQPSPVPVRQRQ